MREQEIQTADFEDMPSGSVALLDENTANRIAAGEVIERPSSVVKELVENAIDAGATRIEVELGDGGKRRIVVRDNGSGMSRQDAVLALQRHATSKIRSADDLFDIHTLGFRGEALPSIASVSDMQILTKRPEDDAATEILVRGGEILAVRDAVAPDGTMIRVENLFFNTPARLKFLKTTQTELNQAVDLIHRLALVWHTLSFRLIHDETEMIRYPGSDDALHAVAAVWGRDVARDMVPIAYASPTLTVRGFVSKPSVSRASRSAQATFVNGRFVRSRTVMHAFDSAFKRLMTTERHPILALFIDIAPHLVDVNVHPAKTEVRFTRDGDVYSAVHHAIENALLSGGLVPEVTVEASLPRAAPEPSLPPRAALSSFSRYDVPLKAEPDEWAPASPPGAGETSPQNTDDWLPASSGNIEATEQAYTFSESGEPARVAVDFGNRALPDLAPPAAEPRSYIGFDGHRIGRLRVLAQSRNTYIVAETDDALLLIDQHIAHERVLYEQMMNGHAETARQWGVIAQHLALPQTLHLSPREARVLSPRLDALEKAGFVIEPFGGETFVVRAVPASIAQKDYLSVLREIIEEFVDASVNRRLLVPHESAIIMASCKMAVKKGDPLTYEEMTRLLADLSRMRNPFTCPHGRPILLALPHREMDRKFHRIGPH